MQQAAAVFNQQGYAGTSISDIMRATGLKKGGIYNHFANKDELALAALDFSVELVQAHYRTSLQGKRHAIVRLRALIEAFCSLMETPPVKGGCPLLNTAIDSDDTHPALRRRARQAMDTWHSLIHKIIVLGVKHQQIKQLPTVDTMATVIIATLEGGLMMTQLYGDLAYLHHAKQHLLDYLDTVKTGSVD